MNVSASGLHIAYSTPFRIPTSAVAAIANHAIEPAAIFRRSNLLGVPLLTVVR